MRTIIVTDAVGKPYLEIKDEWKNLDSSTVLDIVKNFVDQECVITIDQRSPKSRKEAES